MKRVLIVCTTDSMIWNFLIPHIEELSKSGFLVECASSRTGFYFERLKSEFNVVMHEIPFERSPYKIKNIRAFIDLVKLIKRNGYDTVFCHEPVGGAIGRLAGHKCGCKVIYMAHGFHFYNGAPKIRKIYYYVEKFLSRYTDVLVTINQEDYDAAQKFYANKVIKTNGIGVDTKRFTPCSLFNDYLKKEFNLPDNSITMLSVGELISRKNHSQIIKALAYCENPNIYYFIAGDGELKDALKKLIGSLRLDNNVVLLGYRSDIYELCNSADIFVLPSVHEGLSVALMEAMGCGKPVICSAIRGNTDLIDDDMGGFLVPTFDVNAYSQKINRLCADEALRTSMGKYNLNKVKKFDVQIVKKQIVDIFDEVK